MEKLVVASGNKGKIKEIKAILGEFYEIVTMAEMGFNEEVEETGKSFFENSLIKAKAVSEALNCDALADDSGLCVDALDGAPGIYSARYSGDHGDDESNRKLLLENLKGVKNRRAKFVSSIVLYKKGGEFIEGYGETHGTILFEDTGLNGFGY
ncbi:MAG: non-canonical purine NTP pyrophosphatase, partial [Clostridia bacterium]|nr:non-canonical purine NTP pyrophosphatase [Clostridia bacterium]